MHKLAALTRDEFVAQFGGIYEHSAWVAESVWDLGRVPAEDTPEALAQAMALVVANAGTEQQLALILEHPELAGKAACAGDLTDHSREEQSGAGLDRCTQEEWRRLQHLNQSYRDRFGFPFIVAVRGMSRQDILNTLESRLKANREEEFREALRQIDRIAELRLAAHPVWNIPG